eukprot:1055239-Rhodomonas_salina.1
MRGVSVNEPINCHCPSLSLTTGPKIASVEMVRPAYALPTPSGGMTTSEKMRKAGFPPCRTFWTLNCTMVSTSSGKSCCLSQRALKSLEIDESNTGEG